MACAYLGHVALQTLRLRSRRMAFCTAAGMPFDRAGRLYWDHAWEHEDLPDAVNPRSMSVWDHREQMFHGVFADLLRGLVRPRVLEIGCARSAWLPYFAREFGASVAGLDYSPRGAMQAAEVLRRSGVGGDVRCADLFAAPDDWRETFDVVAWFGVAEHFDDATAAVRAAAAFLKPGGLLITEIPNLAGLNGWLQRTCNRAVYDIHVPHDRDRLASHHRDAGLDVVLARYLLPVDFGVVELGTGEPTRGRAIKERLLYLLRLLTGVVWLVDRRLPLPTTRALSGFILVAGRRPSSGACGVSAPAG
jgi:SAM-dependent methyltransferase